MKLGMGPRRSSKVCIFTAALVARNIGQRRAPDRFAKSHVVELGRLGRQTGLDIAQTLAVGQLCESHDPIVFGAAQGAHFVIATVTVDDAGKGGPGQEIHELSEQGLAGVHCPLRESGSRKRA